MLLLLNLLLFADITFGDRAQIATRGKPEGKEEKKEKKIDPRMVLTTTWSSNTEIEMPPVGPVIWKGKTVIPMCAHPSLFLLPCDILPADALAEMERILKYDEAQCTDPVNMANAYIEIDLPFGRGNASVNDLADAVDRIVQKESEKESAY